MISLPTILPPSPPFYTPQNSTVVTFLDIPATAILELFGKTFFEFCQDSGYDKILQVLGATPRDFLQVSNFQPPPVEYFNVWELFLAFSKGEGSRSQAAGTILTTSLAFLKFSSSSFLES